MRSFGRYIFFMRELFVRRESFKTIVHLFLEECVKVGYNSILIVAIVSTFTGAVTTIQTAYNFTSPYLQDYVIAIVARDMLLAIIPTLIALVYAGKVGSHISGELGTMRITEQIDALEVMGINAHSYLVFPKIAASLVMFPALIILAGFLAIYGGYLAGSAAGAISGPDYIRGIRSNFNEFSIYFGLIKAVVFGFLVASISSFRGFSTSGGALEVGQASTGAVISSSIAILFGDYLLTQILYN